MTQLKKNDQYTCTISGYNSEGMGVAHINDRAVFIKDAIEGETWEIKILKVTNGAVYGKGMNLITPAPSRITPVCPVAGKCGGCVLTHMNYEEELKFKLDKVNHALRRIGGSDFVIEEIIPSENEFRYRILVLRISAYHLNGSGRTVAGAVSAFYVICIHHACLEVHYGMPYLDR